MAPDPSVIEALEAAVAASPANSALRTHLAGLLVGAGRPGDAMAHLQRVLAACPDNAEALALAAQAAQLSGDPERARAWRRLHDALAGAAPAGDGGRSSPAAEPGESVPVDWDTEMAALVGQEAAKRVTLADVAGLDQVKARLEMAFLGPMRNPELRKMFAATLRGGLLLWGPPGCGKTFLARAVAGELGAHFLSVGLHDVLDMWLGNSEKKVHELFELARRRAPTVLFFDEVDAIGHARADMARQAGRNVVAQLLTEMDGFDDVNEGLFIIGATNQPWDVDPALRRPGRLDKSLLVLPPDPAAREAVLAHHLRDRPVAVPDLAPVVAATDGFSGADLRLVCEEGAQRAMADVVRTGLVRPIGLQDLMLAVQSMRPSSAPWLEMARNFVTFANSTGEYDELAAYLRGKGKRGR